VRVDLQHVAALAICCDCEGTIPVTAHGRCGECGSSSVARPYSLAFKLGLLKPFRQPDKRFLRGKRVA
jgi:hypothetical protein